MLCVVFVVVRRPSYDVYDGRGMMRKIEERRLDFSRKEIALGADLCWNLLKIG